MQDSVDLRGTSQRIGILDDIQVHLLDLTREDGTLGLRWIN